MAVSPVPSGGDLRHLLKHHGTLELDPVPTMSDADPYNWPNWKRTANLLLVAFYACMGTFTAAGIIPAYEVIASDLGITVPQTSYLTSLQITIIGGSPLMWRPLSTRCGRRPIFLLSLIGSAVFNIACAKTRTYGAMAACRALTALFICPAGAIGSAVVVETFFKNERAKYLGIWTVMVTLGVPLAPLLMGFVTERVSYRWIYWILAMINCGQFFLYVFLGPETRFLRHGITHTEPAMKGSYYKFRRIDPSPITAYEFISPLRMAKCPCVMIPAVAYAMVFLFASVLVTVEIPQLFGEKFHFGPQQLGLQFIGVIVGSIIGEQIGGYASDLWMRRGMKKNSITGRTPPEFRLWLVYIGYALTICGVVLFLVRIQQAPVGHWNVTPIIGAAIGAGGNQIVTTVTITYSIGCYRDEAASIGVFISFVRQVWGFIGPFWFPDMFENVGIANSAGIAAAMLVGCSVIPTVFLHWKGDSLRGHMKARI
ncbi:MFS general substrate transporter [Amniculicola lignicola CBS 123094]|uniref:MFS general substrate transporter n=1 Tax=Amniculicola lignicola CBS 123094 TaxID=1392246 RepID=A0A6A5WLK0_9PLEO|nr:MFS general substrate transporter [Amniculicola lignicola CBS 123094]